MMRAQWFGNIVMELRDARRTVVLVLAVACTPAPTISLRDAADANDTGAALTARTEAERTALGRVGELPANVPTQAGRQTITAETPYVAASGRTCRALQITSVAGGQVTHRLACNDGGKWFFVPDVFGAEDERAAR